MGSRLTAIVTGGGRGIGRAIAQALAREGAAVAVVARTASELDETVRLITAAGGSARAWVADVTDDARVRAVVGEVEQQLGPIDILVNNAGVLGPIGPFVDGDLQEWMRALDVNLRGAIIFAHAVAPLMIDRRRGRIINVASGGGTVPITFFSSYVTSKTAVIRFTECLADELAPHRVFAFSVGPGTVRTAMSEYSLTSPEGQKWLPWFRRIFDEGLDLPVERAAGLVGRLASGGCDVLSGCFVTPFDDLDAMLREVPRIQREHLHSLRLQTLTAPPPNVAAIRRAAEGRQPA
jgi:NAD(P)-dependent dehydrogenase (short-subunit alcohol dehydrogenase family)